MTTPRVTEADRAYFRRIGEASERLCAFDPAHSLEEVFARLEIMEHRLGALTVPAFPRDEELADREAAALALRWRRGRGVTA